MKERYFEFEGREAKVEQHYNILLKVADVAADLELSPEILLKDACDLGEWILGGEVLYIAVKKAKRATYINWVSEYALLERFIRSRMADDGKPEQDLQRKPKAGVPMETTGTNAGLKKGTFYLYFNNFVFYLDEKLKFWFDARSLADFCTVKLEVFGEWVRTVEGVKVIHETAAIYMTAHYAEWKKNGGNKESFDWFKRVVYNFYDSPVMEIRRNLVVNSDRESGREETQQHEASGNQDSTHALMNEFVQTAAHMGRLHRLAMEYRGILAELDHEFKGKRVIFGKLVEAIDRELAYGARWFPGTVGKPVEYAGAASLGKAVGQ